MQAGQPASYMWFNIHEVIDLFDSWGWVVNVFFDGLEEDDK